LAEMGTKKRNELIIYGSEDNTVSMAMANQKYIISSQRKHFKI